MYCYKNLASVLLPDNKVPEISINKGKPEPSIDVC